MSSSVRSFSPIMQCNVMVVIKPKPIHTVTLSKCYICAQYILKEAFTEISQENNLPKIYLCSKQCTKTFVETYK